MSQNGIKMDLVHFIHAAMYLNRKEGNRGHVFILYFISSRSLKLSSSRTLAGDKLFNIVRSQKRSVLTGRQRHFLKCPTSLGIIPLVGKQSQKNNS